MKLCFILSLIFSFQVVSFQSPVISSSSGTREIHSVKTVGRFNSSSLNTAAVDDAGANEHSSDDELDLMCQPRMPFVEQLIAAGLLDSSSRLPVNLQEKFHDRRMKMRLICKAIAGMEEEGEYLCKMKPIATDGDEDDDVSWDYEIESDEEYS